MSFPQNDQDRTSEIVSWLGLKGLQHRIGSDWIRVRKCPVCDSSAREPRGIKRTGGVFRLR